MILLSIVRRDSPLLRVTERESEFGERFIDLFIDDAHYVEQGKANLTERKGCKAIGLNYNPKKVVCPFNTMKTLIISSLILSSGLLIACQNMGQLQSQDQTSDQQQLERQQSIQQEFGVSPRFDTRRDLESQQKPTQVHSDDQPGKSMDMTREPNRF